MVKNILVPCDGSDYSVSAGEAAIWIAKRVGASVTGLNVVDSVSLEGSFFHDLSGALGFEPFMNYSSKLRSFLEEAAGGILDAFEERLKAEGIESHRVIADGVVSSEICEKAKLSDLLVMGRRGVNAEFEYGLMGSVVETVVRSSQRPVLVIPKEFTPPKKPLIAFDESESSSKALHSAAEFAVAFGMPLTVLAVSKGAEREEALRAAAEYLEPYGIEAQYASVEGDPHDRIVEYVNANSFDMVFIGSSHHSKVVSMVLGSTTEYVMRTLEIPFFIER